jgi:Carboxypeptidase regulatory-like domain
MTFIESTLGFARIRFREALRFSLAALFLMVFGVCAYPQGNTGRILGTATDQSGAIIAGATVTVTDVQRGISRTLTADDAGQYAAPNLLPGSYTVRAEAKGFKTVEHSGILLQVGNDIRIDVTLEPGEQAQTVVVTAETPLVESNNATLGGTLSNETINDLPLNGRNYQNLLILRPGMTFYAGGGGWTQSTNGIRVEDNQYIVDGLTNDNPFTGLTIINGPGIAGDAATILPIDGIQELTVEENPRAEFGGKPGAVVNVGLKSGTNSIHGTAYAFGRDSAWDARNYFNFVGQPQRSIALQQYGATLGGPIKRDKFFYFIGYEAQHYTVGNSFQASVPETLPQATPDPKHSLPDAINALLAHGITPAALSLTLTGCTLSPTVSCTGGLYPTNAGASPVFPQGFPSTFGSDNGAAKLDYRINEENTLSGMFFMSEGSQTAEDAIYLQPQWLSVQQNKPIVGGATWTYIPDSHWVNQARFGVMWMNRFTLNADSNVPASTYGIFTGVTSPGSLPQIVVGGFNALGGSPGWPIYQGPDVVYQGLDYVSYLHGNHNFKFGGELRRNIVDLAQTGPAKGQIKFLGNQAFPGSFPLEDLLAGIPKQGQILVGNPQRHLTQWAYAASLQDDWRATPRLTLNLGVRYDYSSPIAADQNLIGNFDPTLGLVQVGKQIGSIYKPDHANFAPRFGFAWDFLGKGTTVLRGGFGIIYDTLLPFYTFTRVAGNAQNGGNGGLTTEPTGAQIVINSMPPVPGSGTINVATSAILGGASSQLAANWHNNGPNQPIFSGVTTGATCGDGSVITNAPQAGTLSSPCYATGINRNFVTPYVSSWNLGIQHSFTSNLALDLNYVGNHGSQLPGLRDINQGIPVLGSATAAPGPYSAAFPYLSFINYLSNNDVSNYNGLQATLTQRATHGLSYTLAYTYSHALDDSSLNTGQFVPQDSARPGREYASSDYDMRHRFTISLTYAIPGIETPGQLLKGWQVNAIVTLQSSQPWLSNDTVDNYSGTSEFADRWDFIGNPSDFTSNQNTIPYCSGTFNIAGSNNFNAGQVSCSQVTPTTTIIFPTAQANAIGAMCLSAANSIDQGIDPGNVPGGNGLALANLNGVNGGGGCYSRGKSVLVPPPLGTFGTLGRNVFRDSGLRNLDLSITKSWAIKERLTAQFRAEFFNILNHPNFMNPYGSSNGIGAGAFDDPSSPSQFGCGCATPDQAAGNPVLGSGGNREIQMGLKLIF